MHKVCFVLIFCLAVLTAGCALGESANPPAAGWSISIEKLNSSALLVTASSPSAKQFIIGDDFSNARRYIEVIHSDGKINESASSVTGYGSRIAYLAHFPIGWSPKNPYGVLSDSFGVVPASFLFPRSEEQQEWYRLDFFGMGMDVHNSGFGDGEEYVLPKDELFETHFVFGLFQRECSFSVGNVGFNIISGGGKRINDSVCENIRKIAKYYQEEFGLPEQILPSYEIGFFPARSYSSLHSGIYYPEVDYEWLAHEMFHLWEPEDKCRGSKLQEEMPASYMQVHAQYEAGIIDRMTRDNLFEQKRLQLAALPKEWLSLPDGELVELRKRNASAYSTLVYSRGALMGEMMEERGNSPVDLFRHYLKERRCSVLFSLADEYGKKLVDRMASGAANGET
jgi:hypothetical protein